MFERFTGPARPVMVLAQEEARMPRHDCTAAGRILARPIRAGTGLAEPGGGVATEPGGGVATEPRGARFCPAGSARGSHVFGR